MPLPLCQGFGSGSMDGQFPPRNLPQSEKHVHMVERWQAQLQLTEHRHDWPLPQAAIFASPPASEN